MESYFLELNAIIQFGKDLPRLKIYKNIKTSIWAIIEPMESISTKNYKIIRSTLKRIEESKINIDWDLPGEKEFSAFGCKIETIKPELYELYQNIITTDDISKLNEIDSETIFKLIEMRKSAIKMLKQKTKYGETSIDNLQMSLMLYVCKITNKNILTLMDSYDHSLDRYISAMNEITKIRKKATINIFNDVYYFSYLCDENTYLVSDDKHMQTLDSKYNKVIKIDEFKKRINFV